MKAYIAFYGVPEDEALLVFANTAREARKLSFGRFNGLEDEWIELRTRVFVRTGVLHAILSRPARGDRSPFIDLL